MNEIKVPNAIRTIGTTIGAIDFLKEGKFDNSDSSCFIGLLVSSYGNRFAKK